MKQEEFKPSRLTEVRYFRDLRAILARYFAAPEGERARLLGDFEFVQKYAWQAARRMVTGIFVAGARTWRAAAREAGRGPELYSALQAELKGPVGVRYRQLVVENAALIKSLPLSVARQTTRRAAETQAAGGRAEGIRGGALSRVSRARAMLIARTETSKASTALAQARSEELGLPWYLWETSRDARVRPSHKAMQGVLVAFAAPPSPERLYGEKRPPAPYNAGNIFNCRCYPAPLMRLADVKWPHKVYHDGRVRVMTLAEFKRINSIRFLQEAA